MAKTLIGSLALALVAMLVVAIPLRGTVYAQVVCGGGDVEWDGLGDGSDWNDASNWVGNAVPPTGADVCIPDVGPTATVVHSTGTTSINSLKSDEAFQISGGTFTIGTTSQLNNSFTLSGGTLTAPAT